MTRLSRSASIVRSTHAPATPVTRAPIGARAPTECRRRAHWRRRRPTPRRTGCWRGYARANAGPSAAVPRAVVHYWRREACRGRAHPSLSVPARLCPCGGVMWCVASCAGGIVTCIGTCLRCPCLAHVWCIASARVVHIGAHSLLMGGQHCGVDNYFYYVFLQSFSAVVYRGCVQDTRHLIGTAMGDHVQCRLQHASLAVPVRAMTTACRSVSVHCS